MADFGSFAIDNTIDEYVPFHEVKIAGMISN
jgi:hypothetical protein